MKICNRGLVIFDMFSTVPGLKSSRSKCAVAGIRVLKAISVALYDMECIHLTYILYNKKLQQEKNLNAI